MTGKLYFHFLGSLVEVPFFHRMYINYTNYRPTGGNLQTYTCFHPKENPFLTRHLVLYVGMY